MSQPQNEPDGPEYLTSLIHEFHQLQQLVSTVENRIIDLSAEHHEAAQRLKLVEDTLRALGVRESDLAVNAAIERGRATYIRSLSAAAFLTIVPIVSAFLAWFIPASLKAINYVEVEERLKQQPPELPQQQQNP